MKHAKYVFIFFALLTGITSCKKDFLEMTETSSILRQEYVKDLQTTADFHNGIYVLLTQFYGTILIYPEIIADNIKPRRSTFVVHYSWNQLTESNSVNMNSAWVEGYKIIRSCSFVLEKAEEYRDQDPVTADNMKAEAYAIRAMVNFFLINTFAQSYNFSPDGSHPGIPFVTTYDWTQPVTRNSVKEVYDGMISDLTTAIPLYKNASHNALLFNSNAAKALLARVYLFKGEYQLAKNLATEVTVAVPLLTGPDYPSKLFTPQETEALFQLVPSSAAAGGTFNTNFQGRFFVGSSSQVSFISTRDLADLLTASQTDARKAWITIGSLGRTITKYPVNVVPNFNPASGAYYQTLIRSSEMFLTAAESYAMLGAAFEDSARIHLDYIRQRADPAASPTTATGTDLIDSIRTERRKELAFEGMRMFDLLRWKKEVFRSDPTNPTLQQLSYPNNKAIAPIPSHDVNLLKLPQNPGY